MARVIDDALLRRIEAAERNDPEEQIPVLVTLTKGSDVEALRELGLAVDHVIESILVVSGRATAAELRALASSEGVERIELDGEVSIPESRP